MSQGQLWLFSKNKISGSYVSNVVLTIEGTFSIEDNLNDTPSNTKVKSTTSATYREEFEVNTIAYHPDTTTWWVIKSDVSTYIQTGEYEHEIELVELLEFYSYRHLPNCAFAPNTYTLQQMLNRVFSIGKQNDIILASPFPPFLDPNKQMPFMSFENFTIANAIKNIARSINAIPKVIGGFVDITGTIVFTNFTLTFINRTGIENTILNGLNDQFQTAYERNANTSDQFLTRSVSNVSNAKSSNLVILPKLGGFKNISTESPLYNSATAKVYLPSKIDRVENLYVFPNISLVYVSFDGSSLVFNKIYSGYYFDRQIWIDKFIESLQPNVNKIRLEDGSDLTIPSGVYTDLLALSSSVFPNDRDMARVNSTDTISTTYKDTLSSWFKNKMTIKSRFDFNIEETPAIKLRTSYFETNTNQITMSEKFREGLAMPSAFDIDSSSDINPYYKLYRSSPSIEYDSLYLMVNRDTFGFFNNKSYTPNYLIQVSYYPIADIKVSYDNDDDSQDEKFFNQSGKVIDAISVTKLITSHTNDSVEGTKIRNAKYTTFSNILPLGQLVRDNNQIYVISQRSIDCQFANENNYFNVIYTLSRNRVARSENIVADSAIVSYKIPDDNLVSRNQLYKDYIELSLTDGNHDTAYLSMSKALIFGSSLAGTNFDYTVLASNSYGSTPTVIDYVQNPSVFDLHKSKLMVTNWQDNNVLGYRVERNSNLTPIQTPILYTDNVGKATDFYLYYLNTTDLENAQTHFNNNYTPDPLLPFTDLTNVNDDFFEDSVVAENNYSINIVESNYQKDPFEIPVFSYMLQANDNYDPKGNVIVSNELFTTFTSGLIRYHYIVSNTRFTAENADKLWLDNPPVSDVNRVLVSRTNNTTFTLRLFSTLISEFPPLNLNTTALQNKHIGFFAVGADGSRKFLWGINDYTMASNNEIVLYINNWRI
jgi:hypothetical protein